MDFFNATIVNNTYKIHVASGLDFSYLNESLKEILDNKEYTAL